MASDDSPGRRGFSELLTRYESWRRRYSYAGKPAWDEPAWDEKRLNFRFGYPQMDWVGYILEPKDDGYEVLWATTERRNEPIEGMRAFFSHLEDAGKYIIWELADGLRVELRLPSVSRVWRAAGLDPRVKHVPLDPKVSRFELKDDPSRYFVRRSGSGVPPENRLLPLTYDELDAVLLEGMPESVTSQL